jgi:dGTPase
MELIAELSEYVADHAPATLDLDLRPAWRAAADDRGRLRVVVDQVAALTDAGSQLRRLLAMGPKPECTWPHFVF